MMNYDPAPWTSFPSSNVGTDPTMDRVHGRTTVTTDLESENVKSDVATLVGVVGETSRSENVSDHELMVAVAAGDCSAFEVLYDRHVRSCFGVAFRIVQEATLAEDIVQEVFTKLWGRPDTFSAKRGAFASWLLIVVRNRSLDKLRQAKGRPSVQTLQVWGGSSYSDTAANMIPDVGPTPHEQAWSNELGGLVRYALDQLPASEYQTITLAYFGGLSQREIAEKLQQPLGTVKTRTRSALHRLHHLLAGQSVLSD